MKAVDEDAVKSYRDRTAHELGEALRRSGVSPREAERQATRVVDQAAEHFERRRREG